jgi:arylsulfatase A-like enzyme
MLIGPAIVLGVFSLAINEKPVVFESPNIILLSADTLRADHLSCYGYFRKTSPNIDAFAKDSVLFQNAISQAPTTLPAHMSIFTSLTPLVHLCQLDPNNANSPGSVNNVNFKNFNILRLDEKIVTLPMRLKENGYLTIGLNEGGGVAGSLGFDKGFDSYRPWGDLWKPMSALEDVRKAIQESKEKKKPLFLFLHNYICHSPYLRSPPQFKRKFLAEKVAGLTLSENDLRTAGASPFLQTEAFWKNVDLSNPQHLKYVISLYDGGISYEDYVFGKIIEILKKEKFYDNSIIIFLSDHGEEFYEHFGKEHGRLFIEHLHVPLIIKFPGNKFGAKVIRGWVRTMDAMPTLFDFLNIKIKNMIQGISFSPLITGRGEYSPLIVSYNIKAGFDTVRFIKGPFVYSSENTKTTRDQLFDIKKDPLEKNNLAVEQTKVAEQMHFMADEILAENKAVRKKIGSKPVSLVQKNDELVSQLKSLGYLQ